MKNVENPPRDVVGKKDLRITVVTAATPTPHPRGACRTPTRQAFPFPATRNSLELQVLIKDMFWNLVYFVFYQFFVIYWSEGIPIQSPRWHGEGHRDGLQLVTVAAVTFTHPQSTEGDNGWVWSAVKAGFCPWVALGPRPLSQKGPQGEIICTLKTAKWRTRDSLTNHSHRCLFYLWKSDVEVLVPIFTIKKLSVPTQLLTPRPRWGHWPHPFSVHFPSASSPACFLLSSQKASGSQTLFY